MNQADRFSQYLRWLATLPAAMKELGSLGGGEIRIVTDSRSMIAAEAAEWTRYEAAGLSPAAGRIGILYEDPVMWFVVDPVAIPQKGGDTLFRGWARAVFKNSVRGKSVVIVPYRTEDSRVALIATYRHVSRRWEAEFPGGGAMNALTYEDVVKLELLEEAGYTINHLVCAEGDDGFFFVDSSLNGSPIRTYLVEVGKHEGACPEAEEVIDDRLIWLSGGEAMEAYKCGWVWHPSRKGVKCYLNQGRNGHCFMTALAHGVLKI